MLCVVVERREGGSRTKVEPLNRPLSEPLKGPQALKWICFRGGSGAPALPIILAMTSQDVKRDVSLIRAEVEPDDLTYLGVFRIQISGPQRSAVPRRLTSRQLRYLIDGRIGSKTVFCKVVKKVLIYLSSSNSETAKILLAELERIEVEGFKLGSCLLLEIQCWIHMIRQDFHGPSVTAAKPRIR